MEQALASTPEMRRYMEKIAEDAAEDVRRRAPYDSGALQESVKGSVELTSSGYVAKVTVGGREAWYWLFPEFGTSRVPARPYLRPGVQATLSRYGGRFRGDRSG
jgi:HK97 gp10 family phage protein